MIPKKTIEELIIRHSTLEKELSSGEIEKKLFKKLKFQVQVFRGLETVSYTHLTLPPKRIV